MGTVRSPRPGIFALASGLQWFALGSTFWGNYLSSSNSLFTYLTSVTASRALILNSQTTPTSPLTPQQKTHTSTISGAITGGSIGYLVRGRSSILPGTLLFSLLGFAGQTVYTRLDVQHSQSIIDAANSPRNTNIWQTLAEKKWSPMKLLTDKEYEAILREKILKVDAEIAILDEDLDALREKERIKDGQDERH